MNCFLKDITLPPSHIFLRLFIFHHSNTFNHFISNNIVFGFICIPSFIVSTNRRTIAISTIKIMKCRPYLGTFLNLTFLEACWISVSKFGFL